MEISTSPSTLTPRRDFNGSSSSNKQERPFLVQHTLLNPIHMIEFTQWNLCVMQIYKAIHGRHSAQSHLLETMRTIQLHNICMRQSMQCGAHKAILFWPFTQALQWLQGPRRL